MKQDPHEVVYVPLSRLEIARLCTALDVYDDVRHSLVGDKLSRAINLDTRFGDFGTFNPTESKLLAARLAQFPSTMRGDPAGTVLREGTFKVRGRTFEIGTWYMTGREGELVKLLLVYRPPVEFDSAMMLSHDAVRYVSRIGVSVETVRVLELSAWCNIAGDRAPDPGELAPDFLSQFR